MGHGNMGHGFSWLNPLLRDIASEGLTEFILEEKIERNPEDQGLRKSLRSCRDAFH